MVSWRKLPKLDSSYYTIKVNKLKILIDDLFKDKKYNRLDFDKIFNKIDGLKQSDSIEFLDETLKNRIEKLSGGLLPYLNKDIDYKDNSLYLLFNFDSVNFVIKNYPRKIIRNVDVFQKKVEVRGKIYDIFPGGNFGKDRENAKRRNPYCNLLIVQLDESDFRCFHFDYIENLVHFTGDNLAKRKNSVSISIPFISSYIRWRGNRYYYIEL